jgi:hypothetical protein
MGIPRKLNMATFITGEFNASLSTYRNSMEINIFIGFKNII